MLTSRSFYMTILILLLSACSSTRSPAPADISLFSPQQLWQQQQHRLQTLTSWQLQGQIAFITPQSRNSASINWQQYSNDFSLNLSGPLGIHVLSLDRSAGLSTLTLEDDRQYQSMDTQQLINQLSPLPIPVNELRYWILGDPLTQTVSLDKYGRVTQAQHALGWQIHYTSYQWVNDIWLPQNMVISKDDMRIKIITRNWKLNAN